MICVFLRIHSYTFLINCYNFRELVSTVCSDCANQKINSSPDFQQKMNGKSATKLVRNKTKTKPYSCSMCNKIFCTTSELKIYVRTHTGGKPYICSLCSKSFTESRSLKSHMWIHSGEKPYICSLCPKSFTELRCLNSHIRIHTGENPYILNFHTPPYCPVLQRISIRNNLKLYRWTVKLICYVLLVSLRR